MPPPLCAAPRVCGGLGEGVLFDVHEMWNVRKDPERSAAWKTEYSLYSLKLRMIMSEISEIILQRKRIDDISE